MNIGFMKRWDKNKFPWDRDIYTGREICSVIEGAHPNDFDFYAIRGYVSHLVSAGEIRKVGGGRQIKWHRVNYRLYSIRNHERYSHHEGWTLHIYDYQAPHERKYPLTTGNRIGRVKTP